MTTLYYDPILDVHHRLPAAMANVTSFYSAAQVAEDAQRLWHASCVSAGFYGELPQPLKANRGTGASLLLAREWGVSDLEERLASAIESSYEPTWDRSTGEFTWGMGLNEPHPRGQFNAFLAAAEASGFGRWERLSAAPLESCRQITGVDFPTVALRQAEWIDGTLHLSLAPVHDNPEAWTAFQVESAGVESWKITGSADATVDVSGDVATVRARLIAGDLQLAP
jgi:hypothetical protein